MIVTGEPGATNSKSSKEWLFSRQSRKVAGATGDLSNPLAGFDSQTIIRRLESLKIGAASSTVYTTLKIVVLAPIATASEIRESAATPGAAVSDR